MTNHRNKSCEVKWLYKKIFLAVLQGNAFLVFFPPVLRIKNDCLSLEINMINEKKNSPVEEILILIPQGQRILHFFIHTYQITDFKICLRENKNFHKLT